MNVDINERMQIIRRNLAQRNKLLCKKTDLPFDSKETTEYLAEKLNRIGAETTSLSDNTGLIAVIKGNEVASAVLLRAASMPQAQPDIHGNRIYTQCCNPITMLLTAAEVIYSIREELAGSVVMLFQTETKAFIDTKDYLNNYIPYKPGATFCLRLSEDLEAPFINFQNGVRMASCTKFSVAVHGCAAHGSTPHMGKDTIVAASAVIVAMQTYASRRNDPLNPFELVLGKITSGTQFNIISDMTIMEGVIRTTSTETYANIEQTLSEIINGAAASMGCTAVLKIEQTVPPAVNRHPKLIQTALMATEKLFGKGSLREAPVDMNSDNFAELMGYIPSVLGFLGHKRLNKEASTNCPDKLDADEETSARGTALYLQFACDFLSKGDKA